MIFMKSFTGLVIIVAITPLLCVAKTVFANEPTLCISRVPEKLSDNFVKNAGCNYVPLASEEFSNSQARQIHNVEPILNRFGIDGKGVQIGIWDEYHVMGSHDEFKILDQNNLASSRVVIGDPSETSYLGFHATHVAGTIAAKGVDGLSKGIAPGVTLNSFHFNNSLNELRNASSVGMILSNHSYGLPVGWGRKNNLPSNCNGWFWWGKKNELRDSNFATYSSEAKKLDSIIFKYPKMSAFFAAGNERAVGLNPYLNGAANVIHCVGSANEESNIQRAINGTSADGYGTVSHYAVAKNIIAVGAAKDQTNQLRATDFSSFGPAADGRIKPDLVANGDELYSSLPPYECTENGIKKICHYGNESGSSMATPVATGVAALVNQQSFKSLSRYLFSDEMKAVLINTATSSHRNGSPTFKTGWGLINAFRAVSLVENRGINRFSIKQPDKKKFFFQKFKIDKDSGLSHITISWVDPPGEGVVNKAAFYVRSPSKKLYYPWSLDYTKPSQNPKKCSYANTPRKFSDDCLRNSWDNVMKISLSAKEWEGGNWAIIGDLTLLKKGSQEFNFSIAKTLNIAYD